MRTFLMILPVKKRVEMEMGGEASSVLMLMRRLMSFSLFRLKDLYKSLHANPHEEFLDDPPRERKRERHYQAMRMR